MVMQPGELCTLAKRVPRAARTGDAAVDTKAENERQALIGVIQHLYHNPRLCVPTFLALTSGKIRVETKREDQWPECYNTMIRIPKYAKAQLLVSRSGGTLTQSVMNLIDRKYPDMIHSLFECATQTCEGTYLPRPLLDKSTSMEVFALRIEALGNLPATWKKRGGILDDGKVVPWLCSPYTMEFDPTGVAKGLKYHGGATASMTQGINITSKYEVIDPLHPMSTVLRCGAVRISLPELFGEAEGPRQFDFDPRDKPGNPLKVISDHLNTLPPDQHPSTPELDSKYLENSEKEAAEQRKIKAKERLSTRAPPAKKMKSSVSLAP